jgi:hypothetical protein
MTDTIKAEGVTGQIEIVNGIVSITRKGLRATLSQGKKGELTIPAYRVAKIDYKKPSSLANGHIHFLLEGEKEDSHSILNCPLTVIFGRKQEGEFLEIAMLVNRLKDEKPAEPQNISNEIAENKEKTEVTRDARTAKRKYAIDDRSRLHEDANKSLDQNLSPEEKVKVIILGLWHSAIIGTEKRCFVYKRGLMGGVILGSKVISWDYLNLNGVQIETGPLSGFVSLQGPGIISKDMSYWSTGNASPSQAPFAIAIDKELYEQAREGVAVLRMLISSVQQARSSTSLPTSIPDEIRKLAKLRDEGILTADEFETKKKELLSRM